MMYLIHPLSIDVLLCRLTIPCLPSYTENT